MTLVVSPLTIDVARVAPDGVRRLAADVFFDTSAPRSTPATLVVCLPGGGLSRRYFDLQVAGGGMSYSIARSLAAAGCIVATIDPPAVGESDSPDDGYVLTPRVVADVCAAATDELIRQLQGGTVNTGLLPLSDIFPVGLGYSAGSLLTVVQQARHSQFGALVLVGFHGRGLPDFLPEAVRPYIDDPEGLREHLVELTKSFFGEALPTRTGGHTSLLVHGDVSAAFVDAMRDAQAPLLGLVGLASLVPGSVSEELRVIDVPVFVGVGQHDIASRAREMPVELPASRDVTVFELPDAGHEQLVAQKRGALLQHIASWIEYARCGSATAAVAS
jgi:pimeloyl-ACP methyl ester carboxylesterase